MLEDTDLLRTMTANLRDAAYVVDTDRRIRFWNRHAEQLTGYKRADVIGRCCCDDLLIHVDDHRVLCDRECPMAATIADGRGRAVDAYLLHCDGRRIPIHISVIGLRDQEDRVVGALQTFASRSTEMAALAAVAGRERYMLICPMTAVANHAFTQAHLAEQIERLSAEHRPVGVLTIRIDRYRRLAASLGQSVCDVLVTLIARTLSADMRACDFLGRWSESQFVAVLPETDAEMLGMIARRLAFLVSESRHTNGRGRIHPAVHVGGCLIRPTDTPAELIERSENHPLAGKHGGRRRRTSASA